MMQGNVLDFIKFGLSHVKDKTVPIGAILPLIRSGIGLDPWEYIYGTTGNKATQSLLDHSFVTYYSKHGWSKVDFDKHTAGWVTKGQIVCDCQGVEDVYSKSQTNANGNYVNYCEHKGLCSAINRPYIIGEAVFNGTDRDKTHVGWVCGFMSNGDVLVMEERGLNYGFVVTQMSKRPWDYRGLMTKRYTYDMIQIFKNLTIQEFVFTRMLEYGCEGDDVKELKKVLIAKGYMNLDATNSRFLGEMRSSIRSYQATHGCTIDGKAGRQTYSSLGVKFKL